MPATGPDLVPVCYVTVCGGGEGVGESSAGVEVTCQLVSWWGLEVPGRMDGIEGSKNEPRRPELIQPFICC
jgi:hypothetical protein